MFSIFNTTPRTLSDCLARSIQQAQVVYLLLHVRSTLLFSTYPSSTPTTLPGHSQEIIYRSRGFILEHLVEGM